MVKMAAPASAGYSNDRFIGPFYPRPQLNRESYSYNGENGFSVTRNDPLSTFSIDVDTASYSNIRRFIQTGQLPPVGAVRIEEMINYFSYDYPEPQSGPFSISTELGPCPWNQENRLVRIGIKAKELDEAHLPPSNLVFLIDISGSMNHANKLPLLKKSMQMLIETMTGKDRISIVVYAGSDRIVLRPTSGDKKDLIKKAIRMLASGGSTHGSGGIQTAYDLARQSFMPGGNNRIILASDGDFNVGITSRGELERFIAEKKESGIYLTVLGFGTGNLHDDTMEVLADRGNGNYAYIDSLLEAKKVLVKERASTLFTLADDVKLQIEFNPARVGSYRLLGYENRALADEDFNNDKKDSGEIGVGHTVTALYEIVPAGLQSIPRIDPLKYQKVTKKEHHPDEILTVKLRYKPRGSKDSLLLSHSLADNHGPQKTTSTDFRFATAVAGYGLLLKHSEHGGKMSYSDLITLAGSARGKDNNGYRAEFVQLLELSEIISR
ncbi:MAG: von Willebrand factor type A domain-containing protein [Deltaproteobacteria bacterium]|nr:von Willebrand factor type A domain-containing protein [Deltaproteobacteria bacterium]